MRELSEIAGVRRVGMTCMSFGDCQLLGSLGIRYLQHRVLWQVHLRFRELLNLNQLSHGSSRLVRWLGPVLGLSSMGFLLLALWHRFPYLPLLTKPGGTRALLELANYPSLPISRVMQLSLDSKTRCLQIATP